MCCPEFGSFPTTASSRRICDRGADPRAGTGVALRRVEAPGRCKFRRIKMAPVAKICCGDSARQRHRRGLGVCADQGCSFRRGMRCGESWRLEKLHPPLFCPEEILEEGDFTWILRLTFEYYRASLPIETYLLFTELQ